MISYLRIERFKCFEDQNITFGRLTLLAGNNGTGKSTVLQALLLLRQAFSLGSLKDNELPLNGELTKIGTAQDALFGGSQEDSIAFTLCSNANQEQIFSWTFYDPGNVENFIKEYSIKVLEDISCWDELWGKRTELFSELTFCNCVRDQLNRLDFGVSNFKIIRRHLTKMNEYCRKMRMKNEDFIPDYTAMGIEASKESPETLKHLAYQREFLCPDGNTRLFVWHSKQKGQNLRVHFCPPDHGGRNFIIGYVGPHLNTIKYH